MAPSGESEIDIARLRDWIGREERVEEVIGATPVRMLAATLDHDDPPPRPGSPIPPLAHWLYTIPVHRHSELAADGHVRRGGFMPDVPLPRRMFAGARTRFLRPLRIGEPATRIGRVADIQPKEGRTGTLVSCSLSVRWLRTPTRKSAHVAASIVAGHGQSGERPEHRRCAPTGGGLHPHRHARRRSTRRSGASLLPAIRDSTLRPARPPASRLLCAFGGSGRERGQVGQGPGPAFLADVAPSSREGRTAGPQGERLQPGSR